MYHFAQRVQSRSSWSCRKKEWPFSVLKLQIW